MDGLIEILYLIGIVLVGFVIYTIYCYIVRFQFAKKWKNLDIYCKRNGYVYNGRARHQTNYKKELSRVEVQKLLDFYNIDCVLPYDLRFFDNIAVTYTKPYTRRRGMPDVYSVVEHRGGERTHRYMTIEWLENGHWLHYTDKRRLLSREPYVDADFGGMSNQIYPTDTQESIENKLKYELRDALRSFVENDVERWLKKKDNKS